MTGRLNVKLMHRSHCKMVKEAAEEGLKVLPSVSGHAEPILSRIMTNARDYLAESPGISHNLYSNLLREFQTKWELILAITRQLLDIKVGSSMSERCLQLIDQMSG